MPAALVIYLFISMQFPGQEPYEEMTKQTSLLACSLKAAHFLERVQQAQDESAHRAKAECILDWPGHDPA